MTHERPLAWALVPVRRLGDAKSRLSPVLSPAGRANLQRGMLSDVLAALAHTRAVANTAVVSADPEVAQIARTHGAHIFDEAEPGGLNAAVAAATEALASRGIPLVIVLPADVPLADPVEIDQAIELARSIDARVVVPDRRSEGTNAFVFSTADPPAFAYGPGSLRRHLNDARRRPARLLALSSLALDIDLPSDLSAFIKSVGLDRAPHTRAALADCSAAVEELP
jgi:2-phospho-L-lactate/phosphoenolpyruvate guanylyltransferase